MKNVTLILMLLLTMVSCDLDEDTNPLKGEWNWTSTCGGVTGQCGYPDKDNFRKIEITDDKMITVEDGVRKSEMTYMILNKRPDGDQLLVEVKMGNGSVVSIRRGNEELTIERGDLWESYERIRYPQLTR